MPRGGLELDQLDELQDSKVESARVLQEGGGVESEREGAGEGGAGERWRGSGSEGVPERAGRERGRVWSR